MHNDKMAEARDKTPSERTTGVGLLRSVTTVASGTAIAQLIFIGGSPIISRLYSAEDYGAFATFQSLTMLIALVATGRYEAAIPLPPKRQDADRLLHLSLGLAAASGLTVLVAGLTLLAVAEQPLDWRMVLLLSVAIFSAAAFTALTQFAARDSAFHLLSSARIVRAAVATLVQLLLAVRVGGSAGLAIGLTAGYVASTTILLVGWRPSEALTPRAGILTIARTFRRFPQFSAPAAGVTALGTTALPALLAAAHGVATAGHYALATRVLQLPIQLLGQALGQVLYPSLARSVRNGHQIRTITLLTASALLRLSSAVFTWLLLFGDVAFAFVFGGSWLEAGRFAQILSPWLFGSFVSGPLSQLALVFERNRTTLAIAAAETSVRLCVVAIGAILGSSTITAIGLSFSGFVITFLHTRWTLGLGGVRMVELIRRNAPFLFFIALLALISLGMRFALDKDAVIAALAFPLFAVVGLAGAAVPARQVREARE